ncbi:eye-specific diacylglycerol kinase [Trichonephila clavipes]|nr:eye-specific diacylglycerol kinase [Trichonephila clavipes]
MFNNCRLWSVHTPDYIFWGIMNLLKRKQLLISEKESLPELNCPPFQKFSTSSEPYGYGGGTKPWGTSGFTQFQPPATDDGMIEVIGLTTYQLPLLQAGGHGSSIAQCKKAKLVTSCTIPVQVDGEPCRLLPSIIQIELLNTVNMIAKTKVRFHVINL